MKIRQKPPEKVWIDFQALVQASPRQLEQFQKYADYLMDMNELFNLTAITELSGVVRQHFEDSLALAKFVDMSGIKTIADVGTGAGFPAIPLKIMYPHLKVILIEVTKKKQEFLANVIDLLGLENVEICDMDWRTFVRHPQYEIDYFITRAALDEVELGRAFRNGCSYNKATLVYWVSKDWECSPKVAPLVKRIEAYRLGNKDRRLVFMGL